MSFIFSFIFVYYELSKRNQTWTRRCNWPRTLFRILYNSTTGRGYKNILTQKNVISQKCTKNLRQISLACLTSLVLHAMFTWLWKYQQFQEQIRRNPKDKYRLLHGLAPPSLPASSDQGNSYPGVATPGNIRRNDGSASSQLCTSDVRPPREVQRFNFATEQTLMLLVSAWLWCRYAITFCVYVQATYFRRFCHI